MKLSKVVLYPVAIMFVASMVGCGGGGGGGGSSRDSQSGGSGPQNKTVFSEWVGDMMEINQDEVVVDVENTDVDENDSNQEGAFDGFFE